MYRVVDCVPFPNGYILHKLVQYSNQEVDIGATHKAHSGFTSFRCLHVSMKVFLGFKEEIASLFCLASIWLSQI